MLFVLFPVCLFLVRAYEVLPESDRVATNGDSAS